MIDTDKYEGHAEGDWYWADWKDILMDTHGSPIAEMTEGWNTKEATARLIADAPLLLAEVKRLRGEPTVTVDDYHKKGHLYVTIRFPDGEEYVGLVEKYEGDEE